MPIPILHVLNTGTKEYKLPNGQLHREDGPAIERSGGNKEWWLYNKRHRVDGPALEFSDGEKRWFINGKLHREDGPAIEYYDGSKSWHLNGCNYSEEDYKKLIKKKYIIRKLKCLSSQK